MPNKLFINYKSLRQIEKDEQINVGPLNPGNNNEGVVMTKILSTFDSQNFKINMAKGSRWGSFYHDCDISIINYKGDLVSEVDNKKINRLDALNIEAYTNYSLKALEESIFYIEFKNSPEIIWNF